MQTESKPQAQRTRACWGLARSRTRLSDPWPGLREGRRRGPAGGQGRLWPGPATRRWRQELPAEPRASSYFPRKKCLQTTPPPEARGPQPMTQASAAATELLPRQPGSVRGQALSPAPARPVPAGTPSRLRPQPRALALGAQPAQATSSEMQLSLARWGGSLGMASAWALGAHGGCPGETLKGRPCVGPRGPELPRPLLCSQQTLAV